MFILKVEHIEKTYSINGDMVKAVNDISFSIEQGEFVAITGSSGSGKSTLLHIIGGVDSASAGTVDIKGVRMQDLKGDELAIFRRKNISIIYQFYNLIPILNVKENITLPLKLDHQIIDEERLSFFLNILNLDKRVNHLPSQLSGGQQQRVAIARALMSGTSIILADEPTGNLDKKSSKEIIDYLCEINKSNNQTILMVTHDMEIAKRANRILIIEDGKIVKESIK
ncbi:ABC transporter ATP-binding protein [[Clostridium] innocuum]|nr:ABC transporter ATP-binding protein [[Clostridium] innocuum]